MADQVRRWARAGAAALMSAAVGRQAAAAPPVTPVTPVPPAQPVTPGQVSKAIDLGRAYLFAHQHDGNWEEVQHRDSTETAGFGTRNVQWGGMTALATFGLLASGVPATEPHVKKAVGFLRSADLRGNYAIGLRAQVWPLLPPEPWVRQAAAADARTLLDNIKIGPAYGAASGLYGYDANAPAHELDHSASQFAVLGVWAANQAGADVPTPYWTAVDAAWRRQQLADGSWAYFAVPIPGEEATNRAPGPSMTAAGVATLFLAREFTQASARCNGNVDDAATEAGMAYLGGHLADVGVYRRYYTLFGVSRVGLASGYKYLGTLDWFRFGSAELVADQDARTGGWVRQGGSENVAGVPDTAFALLFLARGQRPIMMNKLRYDTVQGRGSKAKVELATTWDQRPRDVANLARWVGTQIESPLNWQVVDLHGPADDLLDAPILYMAGGKPPSLSDGDVAKLRTYCQAGGMIVGHADCSAAAFANGYRELGERMFPGRRFRPLESTHPIFTNEQFPLPKSHPPIEGLSNGSRELMVLLPVGDPAKVWQTQSFRATRVEAGGQMMVDLFLYAVEKEGLRRRGETYLVRRDARVADSKAVRVARLKYAGNWDPEPGGWRRLTDVLHNGRVAELKVDTFDVGKGAVPDPKQVPLASLTFSDPSAKLSDAVRAAIRKYVEGGGTLLVDVAGGHAADRTAAEAEVAKVFPKAPRPLPVLGADSPVYTADGPRSAVKAVTYRRFERTTGTSHAPRLRGLTVGNRVAVIYSPEDLSTGLVGQPIDGVAGYVPDDATRLATAVVAYAAKPHP